MSTSEVGSSPSQGSISESWKIIGLVVNRMNCLLITPSAIPEEEIFMHGV